MKLVAIALVCLIAGTIADDQSLITRISKTIQLGEISNFGSYISDLLQVKLGQQHNVDQILNMIQKILDGLVGQQTSDDSQNSQTSASLQNRIDNLEQSIDSLNEEQSSTNRVIVALSEEIAGLASSIASSGSQLTTLSDQVNSLTEQRTQEHAEYERRQASYNRLLNAVITVQTKLTSAVLDQEGAVLLERHRKDIVKQLKKELGERNPIALMVEITSKFDVPTAIRVIDKLESIAQRLTTSLKSNDEQELKVHTTYQTAVGQLDDVISRLSRDLYLAKQQSWNKQNDLVVAQRRTNEISEELDTSEQLLVATRNQLNVVQANHQAKSDSRAEEIRIVTTARDILRDNKDSFQA